MSPDLFNSLSDQALLLGLAVTRVAVAFLMLPIFANEVVPTMVRNAIFVAFALIAVVMQATVPVETLHALDWVMLFAKEMMVGVAIGLLFGLFLWAFEAAGQVIDMQVGATIAQVTDPLTGQQTSLTGEFLGRLANFAFMAAGGLLLFVGALIESFVFWPIGKIMPDLTTVGLTVFETEFSRFIMLTLLIASPMLVVLFIIDSMFGLINRYAQQLNVFFLSMSLKAVVVVLLLILMIHSLVQLLVDELVIHAGELSTLLQGVFSHGD